MPEPTLARFAADVTAWLHSDEPSLLPHILRSRYSGVPHDAAAAYARLARRFSSLLDAIERGAVALPANEREATITFGRRLRALRTHLAATAPEDIDAAIFTAFGIDPNATSVITNAPASLSLQPGSVPEAPTGVPTRTQHFSASALNAYAECPRKWYYRYVCSAVEDEGSSASFYGTAFHLALEWFHEEFLHPSEASAAQMRERLAGCIRRAFEHHRDDFDSLLEVEMQERRAQRTALRYIDWLVAESRRAPFTIVGREIPANLEIEGYSFVGYIDRLDRDDRTGDVSVIDYKTGAIATTANEYRAKVSNFADFQLPYYYWARTAAGDHVTRLTLLPLKDATLDVRPVTLEVVSVASKAEKRNDAAVGQIGIDELERARTRIVEICGQLTSGALERFPVATDPSACTYCAYQNACVDRPIAERGQFAR